MSQETISAVAMLADTIWNQHFVSIIGREQVDYMLKKFQSAEAIQCQIDSGYEYYVASQHDQFVAYLALVPDNGKVKVMLSKVYVLQEARGEGVGAQLLEFAKQRSLDLGAGVLWLTVNRDNEPSIGWYKRKGFIVTREAKADIGNGFYMDDFIMEYELK
jgi:ribosomal protein S18 acetylase RimI-like enzyme